jgi:hypothetical protein
LANRQEDVCRHIKVMADNVIRSRCAAAAMQRAANPPLDYLNGLQPREADIRRTRCLEAAMKRFIAVPQESAAVLVRSAPGVGSKRQRLDDIPFLKTAQGKKWWAQLFGDWRQTVGYVAKKHPVEDPIADACKPLTREQLHKLRLRQDAEWRREWRKRRAEENARQDEEYRRIYRKRLAQASV